MNPPPEDQVTPGLMDDYSTTQKEVLAMETRKTSNKLFTIAFILFISDLIALVTVNAVNATTLAIIAVIPLIIAGLAILSLKEPLLAMILMR